MELYEQIEVNHNPPIVFKTTPVNSSIKGIKPFTASDLGIHNNHEEKEKKE
jgi:hypothetical protein